MFREFPLGGLELAAFHLSFRHMKPQIFFFKTMGTGT
jgi:hypothetical protein